MTTAIFSNEASNEGLDAMLANLNGATALLQLRSGADDGPDAAASGTLVSQHTLANPAFSAAGSKVALANAIANAVSAAGGTPSHARLTKPDGTTGVVHLTCGGSFTYTVSGSVLTTNAAHSYAAGTPVRVFAEPGGSLSPNFSQDTTYYVLAPSGSTLELAATPGGAAVAPGGAGTAVQRICLASVAVAIGSNTGAILAGSTVQIVSVRMRMP